MNENTIREKLMEFEKQRQSLMGFSMQKQQLQSSITAAEAALKELENAKEKTVYKAAGPILVLRDLAEVKKEMEDTKETNALRLKTVEKQEKTLVDKLNALRTEIESIATPAQGAASKKENN